MVNFKLKTMQGKTVGQMVGSSKRKLVKRVASIKGNDPGLAARVAAFKEILKRHELAAVDPRLKGTKAGEDTREILPASRKMVGREERKLRRLQKLESYLK